MKAKGTLLTVNKDGNYVGNNGRTYSKDAMDKAIAAYMNLPADDRLGGLLDFDGIGNISHKVVDVRVEGDRVTAEIEVLDTPQGELLKTLMFNSCYGLGFKGIGETSGDSIDMSVLTSVDVFDAIDMPELHRCVRD